jgi:hypothetical protein
MSEPYLLSPHVHICVAGGQVVLLDLARDEYLAVVPPHRLAGWVKGWPVLESDRVSGGGERMPALTGGPAAVQDPVLAQMLATGMLVTDRQVGKEAVPVQIARPESALVQPVLGSRPRTTALDLGRLGLAHARARIALKLRPIEPVVKGVARRKTRALESRSGPGGMAPEALRDRVAAFLHLRPLFYSARGACLLDSLVLLGFLAQHGVFPQWVFGVLADPFYAHCWVQQDQVVFNDSPDFVRGFTPILVV